jgi:hypothetical protein
MLADGEPPRVHWHPEFKKRLATLVERRVSLSE